MREFVPQRTAAYISQNDLQIGEMTVRETLEFYSRCQGSGSRYGVSTNMESHYLYSRFNNLNIFPNIMIQTSAFHILLKLVMFFFVSCRNVDAVVAKRKGGWHKARS